MMQRLFAVATLATTLAGCSVAFDDEVSEALEEQQRTIQEGVADQVSGAEERLGARIDGVEQSISDLSTSGSGDPQTAAIDQVELDARPAEIRRAEYLYNPDVRIDERLQLIEAESLAKVNEEMARTMTMQAYAAARAQRQSPVLTLLQAQSSQSKPDQPDPRVAALEEKVAELQGQIDQAKEDEIARLRQELADTTAKLEFSRQADKGQHYVLGRLQGEAEVRQRPPLPVFVDPVDRSLFEFHHTTHSHGGRMYHGVRY